jgi:hypothetical protein
MNIKVVEGFEAEGPLSKLKIKENVPLKDDKEGGLVDE